MRRVTPLAVYLAGLLPFLWLVWLVVHGDLGADPVKRVEHQLGEWGLKLIVAVLAVTPLRRFTGVNLIRYRRAIGLLAFAYITLHLMTWLALDIQFRWGEIWADIVKRRYITAGMLGFALMVPLAITSNNRSIRNLGPKTWQKLHRLTYFAALAGAIHYIWLVKAWPIEPVIYLILVILLLATRLIPQNRSRA
ncbi:MAG: protein-methionine-sulfoxide reductase heme-binding subunit MsrQ [Pseudorhodobacter sp.]|nr:protein-methionine-sulfoxide reductase heme-binding subunit MsrQ [Pseudorhodobacter sp.]